MNNNNITTNRNGCPSFLSTENSCCDFFVLNSKTLPSTFESFQEIVNIIVSSKNESPTMFIKTLKFHRLIDNGNGIRWIYYLSMLILKMEDVDTYESVLKWSWEYPKDFHNLHRLQAYPTKLRKVCSPELIIYGDLIFSMFLDLLKNSFDQRYNPMLIKYLSFEKGHWYKETTIIWNYLETLFQSHCTIMILIKGKGETRDELAGELRNILFSRITQKNYKRKDPYFTKKVRRQIKVLFNHHINLTDNLFKGIHSDGSIFGSHVMEEEKEIDMIYNVIRKTPSISNQLFSQKMKTIQRQPIIKNQDILKSFEETGKKRLLRNDFLIKGYLKYIESIKSKKIVAKVRGVDLSDECYEYFLCKELDKYDYNLESKLNEMIKNSHNYLMSCFNETFTCNDFANNIILLIDISGSMDGKPISIGFLYILVMIKLFRVKQLYTFNNTTQCIILDDNDIDGRILDLLDKIYKRPYESTNLNSALKLFDEKKIQNKKIMIVTDGDCDISADGTSPFREAIQSGKYNYISSNFYLVVNVNIEKICFPYLGRDINVCYVSGNSTKCMRGLIKSFIISIEQNVPISPLLVLQYSMDTDELDLPLISMKLPYCKKLSIEEVEFLYDSFQENRPFNKKIMSEENMSEDDMSEDDRSKDNRSEENRSKDNRSEENRSEDDMSEYGMKWYE